ncbi:hypothetical protein GTY41_09385 [Streptomyces sp. SID685]|uniref:DUF6924 domain-containing protein n=1 Tax=Streptomyces sp. SID685 TaxID=2690322 RepID=UPI00136DB9B7|nr:hypothetical protein [Streptomyces sp. SID685]MYR85147.1 hypothetical protein [Streptomyces sp. SID685]
MGRPDRHGPGRRRTAARPRAPDRGEGLAAHRRGQRLENPVVTLCAGADPGIEKGWDEIEEATVVSTTGFLALCDSGYEPVRKQNLATAGPGPYLVRVHASDRSTDGKKPRFLIQIIPADRTGTEPAPPTIEEATGPLLVRTSFDQPEPWARLLKALERGSAHYEAITVIDNPFYTGFTADQLQARISRDEEDWPDSTLLLIADGQALACSEFPLLAVNNLPDEDDDPFRITLAAAGSFIVNIELGNTSFGDWSHGADNDGVYRKQHY